MSRYLGPTPERLAKAGKAVEPVESETGYTTLRMLDGSPLEQLATTGKRNARKGITGDQYHAGARYFSDAYLAGMFASGVPDLVQERVDGGQHKGVTSTKLEAMSRYNAALKALDRASVDILRCVVLHEMPLATYADRFRTFPQARERRAIALQRLRDALDQLDQHYYPPRRDGIRSAHSDVDAPKSTP